MFCDYLMKDEECMFCDYLMKDEECMFCDYLMKDEACMFCDCINGGLGRFCLVIAAFSLALLYMLTR